MDKSISCVLTGFTMNQSYTHATTAARETLIGRSSFVLLGELALELADELEQAVALRRLVRVHFREGERAADAVEEGEGAAEAARVANAEDRAETRRAAREAAAAADPTLERRMQQYGRLLTYLDKENLFVTASDGAPDWPLPPVPGESLCVAGSSLRLLERLPLRMRERLGVVQR